MSLTPTDFSLMFLGIMIVMVLLEVRRLGSRTPEPVSRLEAKMDALTEQLAARMAAGHGEIELAGGAQLVDLEQSMVDLSDEVDRLGQEAEGVPGGEKEGTVRFLAALDHLRRDIGMARELFARVAEELSSLSGAMESAATALQVAERRLDTVLMAGGEAASMRPRSGRGGGGEETDAGAD